ncbi:MAG: transcriptional regulator [Alphaproteobacteria bacterium]|nr:transcriptional regulator [Alphaproteobacteria bacterium]
MALSRSVWETVDRRLKKDAGFREAVLQEGLEALMNGDVDVGKAILRRYIHATGGFEKLAEGTGLPPTSLHRMFGPKGNPTIRNLASVVSHWQKKNKVKLRVIATR